MTPPTGLSNAEAVAAQMNDGSLMILPVQFVRDLLAYVRALEAPSPAARCLRKRGRCGGDARAVQAAAGAGGGGTAHGVCRRRKFLVSRRKNTADADERETQNAIKAIERASDNFGLCDPLTGIHFETGKKASAASKSRFPLFVHEKTPEEYKARLSLMAHARAAKKRAERGDTCVNGHPVSNLGGECFECRRARQPRVNEMRRLADAAKRRLVDFGLEDAA